MAAKTTGAATPIAARTVCWTPIVTPLRSAPASSAAAVNESPFHAIVSPPARTRTGTRSHVGPPATTAVSSHHADDRETDEAQRYDTCSDAVGPPASADPEHPTQHLRPGEHQRSRLSGKPCSSTRKRTPNPSTAICAYRKRPLPNDSRQSLPSADRRRDRGRLDPIGNLATAKDESADERAGRAQCGEEEKGGLGAAGVGDRGQRQRADETPERDRRLPHSECEPTLVRGEPVHDRTSARRVDAPPAAPTSPSAHDDLARKLEANDAPHEAERGAEQAGGEHQALAEAVRGEPPRKERQGRSDPRGGEHDADLARARGRAPRVAEGG